MTLVESTVELASGLRLSCARVGAPEDPAVVFLPGPTDSWRSYEEVLHQLPAAIHAVAVSCRGHGDSDKSPTRQDATRLLHHEFAHGGLHRGPFIFGG